MSRHETFGVHRVGPKTSRFLKTGLLESALFVSASFRSNFLAVLVCYTQRCRFSAGISGDMQLTQMCQCYLEGLLLPETSMLMRRIDARHNLIPGVIKQENLARTVLKPWPDLCA